MQIRNGWLRGFAGVVVAGIVGGALVFCQEEPIEIELLPHSVLDALKAKFSRAEMARAYKKEFVGRAVYEIVMTQKRQKIGAIVAENGGILQIEKEIPAAELPEQVSRAIMAKHPGLLTVSAREVTQISYKVLLKSDSGEKTITVSVDPSGMIEENEDD